MRVVLIDDEIPTLQYNTHIVKEIDALEIVGTFHRPSVFFEQLDSLEFDLLLCDIELPGVNGIDLVSRVSEKYPHVFIVFLTAYSDYALKAFRVNAMDYLLKPLKREDLENILDKIEKYVPIHKGLKKTKKTKALYFPEFKVLGLNQQEVKWSTHKSKELCAYFLLHQGKTITKNQILNALWAGVWLNQEDAQFHMTLYRMRKTIQLAKLPIVIHSVAGSKDGYRCESDVDDEVEALLKQLKKKPLDMKRLSNVLSTMKAPFLSENNYQWMDTISNEIHLKMIAVLESFDLQDQSQRKIYTQFIILLAFQKEFIKQWLLPLVAIDKREALECWATIKQLYQYANMEVSEWFIEIETFF